MAADKTQQQAADSLGMARTTVVAIEKGQRSVQPEELVSFAGLYRISMNELLRPTKPADDFVAEFRLSSLSSDQSDDEIVAAVRELQTLADDYVELERLLDAALPQRYPPTIDTKRLAPMSAGESMAAAERNRLGLGDGPVLELRRVLEADVGLRVFGLELPSRVAGLFIGSSVYGACLAFNIKHPYERQRWTQAHEYAHFLAHRNQTEVTATDRYERTPKSERLADSFAENFLMPASGLQWRFQEIAQSRSDGATPADILALAARYHVSTEAMALRLENLSLVKANTWDRLKKAGFRVNEARQILRLSIPQPDTEPLPSRYRYLAVEAHSQGELSEGQFARFLRLDRTSARLLARRLSSGVELSEYGPPTLDQPERDAV